MSRIIVDQLVASGNTSVSFPEGLKIFGTKTLDLNGAAINLSTGLGVAGQLLSSTGSSVEWVTRTDTNTTYTISGQEVIANEVRLNLTAGGSGSGTQYVTIDGAGASTLSYNPSTNRITVSGVNTNTTYSISADDGTAGKKIIRLTAGGSGSGTDDVTLVPGSNITLNRVGDEITINSSYVDTDTNTTYTLDGSNTGGTVNLELIAGGSGSGTDTVKFVGSGLTTLSWNESQQQITITTLVSDANTTYSVSSLDGTAGKKIIRLSGSDTSVDDITLAPGSNITLNRVGDEITINSNYVDTNTTYTLQTLTNPQNREAISFTPSSGSTTEIVFFGNHNVGVTRSGNTILFSGITYNLSAQTAGISNAVNLSLGGTFNSPTSSVAITGINGVTVSGASNNTVVVGRAQRTTVSSLTNSLAVNGLTTFDLSGYSCYTILGVRATAGAWVRIYTDNDSRSADQVRVYGSGTLTRGLITDFTATGSGIVAVQTPNTVGYTTDPSNNNLYLTVANRGAISQPIFVSLNILELE